jgi:4-hydroxythreonine-4-phosphate dehydrogenase
MSLPRIILTAGEPAGIGPDLCLAIAQRDWPCDLVFAIDRSLLHERAARLGLRCSVIESPSADRTAHRGGALKVIERRVAAPVQAGKLDVANARYVLDLLDLACDGCLSDEFDAMVTAPSRRASSAMRGWRFSGIPSISPSAPADNSRS